MNTGAVINATFVSGISNSEGIVLDGNGHLFEANYNGAGVREYDAVTGASVNSLFITGLDHPMYLAIVPEPRLSEIAGVVMILLSIRIRRIPMSSCRIIAS
jgi:hypothetical protein